MLTFIILFCFSLFTASGTTTVAAIFCHVVMLVAVGLLEFTMQL